MPHPVLYRRLRSSGLLVPSGGGGGSPALPGVITWLDAGAISATDGDQIQVWPDISGNNRPGTDQGVTSTLWFTYRATGGPNNKPCIERTQTYVTNAGITLPSGTAALLGSGGELHAVWKAPADNIAVEEAIAWNLSADSYQGYPQYNASLYWETVGRIIERFAGARSIEYRPPAGVGSWRIYSASTVSGYSTVRQDGKVFGIDQFPSVGASDPLYVNYKMYQGKFAELVICSAPLSDADRQSLYDFWATKYGLTVYSKPADFSPASFSGLQGWWAADSLSLNNDDAVASWPDLSGNSHDFSQSNSSYKPVFKTNRVNGKPAINWADTHRMGMSGSISISQYADFTLIQVMSPTAGSIGISNPSSNLQFAAHVPNTYETTRYYNNGEGSLDTTFSDYTQGGWRSYGWRRGQSSRLWTMTCGPVRTFINSAYDGTFTFNGVGYSTTCGYGMTGDIAEIIMYNTALEDWQLMELYHNYLRPKYSV